MDGFQKIKDSLQFKLSVLLTTGLLLFALGAGAISFFHILHEAEELLDDELEQIAVLIRSHHFSVQDIAARTSRVSIRQAIIVQPLSIKKGYTPALNLPSTLKNGFQKIVINGSTWCLLVTELASGERFVVAQQPFLRNKIAKEGMMAICIPFLCFACLAAMGTFLLVRRFFRPIREMAASIDKRDKQDLSPICQHRMPSELIPFIDSLNRMFSRVTLSIEMQRRFIADAAHELRSPLTAITLQAERLDAVEMPAPAKERLNALRTGLNRASTLLSQLLTLARAQGHKQEQSESLSLMALFRQVLSDMVFQAEVKDIDLGIASSEDVVISIPPAAAVSILKNLVDNAIRYTPNGGRIDLYAGYKNGVPFFSVADTGPGIPPEEMNRVFDPFYRVPGSTISGSGLGLSIVKTLVESSGGTVSLKNLNTDKETGLCVTISFPPRKDNR